MSTPFRTSRLVEFSDTDMAGIMHFAAFFRYMESAEHEMLRSWGHSIFDTANGQIISFPRVAASCEYRAPARSEDVLQINVCVRKLGTKSVTYVFRFLLNDHEIAAGEITAVCCRIEHRRPPKSIEIPADIAAHLRSMVED